MKAVRERGGDGPRIGRAWCPPLADRVLVVAVCYRTDLTMRQLCRCSGSCRPRCAGWSSGSGPSSRLSRSHAPADAADRLWIVDGTLVPVRDRTVGASSRNHRFSANVQVVIDADTRRVVATARPAPGNEADAHVWRDSGLPEQCQGITVLGDGACIDTGPVVPHRKRPGRALLAGEEADNAEHRRVRTRVEHAIGRLENYKILRDCRQPGDGLHHAVQAVAHMHNLALAT